jgi:hypothetical protein
MPDDGKQILENASPAAPEARLALVKDPEPVERKPPPGCVERILNFKDRNFIVGACRAYCEKEGHKGFKDQKKLDQVTKLLNFEATLDYNAAVGDHGEELTLAWEAATARWKLWRRYKEKLITADEIRKTYPDLDLERGVEKPPLRAPEISAEEQRGKDSTFYIPSKLDAWVQDALRAMDWTTVMTRYAVELCEKFGIKDE